MKYDKDVLILLI